MSNLFSRDCGLTVEREASRGFRGSLLVVGLVAVLSVPLLASPAATERTPFAIPASARTLFPWRVEVDRFAARLEDAFKISEPVASQFAPWILEASRRHTIRPELLASVIFTESTFRTDVVSSTGAVGPAQVQPFWRSFCGATSLEDPAENIYCGAQILAYLRDICGNDRCALEAYNVGLRNHRESTEEFAQAGRRYVSKVEHHLAGIGPYQTL